MTRVTDQSKKDDKSSPGSSNKPTTEISNRKRNLTLDFQFYNQMGKKAKFDAFKDTAPVLSSPDMKKLKLQTPELESIILQNGLTGATPTPTSSLLFPKVVTEAQEDFSRGFVNALNELHYSGDSSQGGTMGLDVSSNNSNSSMTYTDLAATMSPQPLIIKEEQIVPSMCDSPRLSPIDMDTQEVIKLERKRMRNRVAASKCRRRKLERISRLEDKVKGLKDENAQLSSYIVKLKDQVCVLKGQVLHHVNSGCPIKGPW